MYAETAALAFWRWAARDEIATKPAVWKPVSLLECAGLRFNLAEREGFEPPEVALNGFQDRRIRPLCHLSAAAANIAFLALSITCVEALYAGFD